MFQAVGYDRRILVELQIRREKDLERTGVLRRGRRIDQHQIQRPTALERVKILELRHSNLIWGIWEHVMSEDVNWPGRRTQKYQKPEQTSEAISTRGDGVHILLPRLTAYC